MIPVLKRVHKTQNLYADENGNIYDVRNGILGQVALEIASNGYLVLPADYYGFGKSIHRLVAKAFHGQVYGFEVDHKNGKKLDNRACNLQILTRGEHVQKHKPRKVSRGVTEVIEQNAEIIEYLRKYTPEVVSKILNLPLIKIRSVQLEKQSKSNTQLKKQKKLLTKSSNRRKRVSKNKRQMLKLAKSLANG